MHDVPRTPRSFIVTKEHRRFVEFANVVRKNQTIGLCYGPAGIGKTVSALRLSNWSRIEKELLAAYVYAEPDEALVAACVRSNTVFYTARVGSTWRQVRDELGRDLHAFERLIGRGVRSRTGKDVRSLTVSLVIIDEAERLNASCLDWVRDEFDHRPMGLILTGMPGIEKRLSRFPQLYSRVGFAHEYRPLQRAELLFVLKRHWRKLGLELDEAEFTDAQAIAAIARITGGNFRLLQRLFAQIERVLRINELTAVTDDVVEAARSTLVIGAT